MKKILIITFLFLSLASFGQIPIDKKYHFYAGNIAAFWGTFAADSYGTLKPFQCALYGGMGTAIVAGIGKECIDQFGGWVFNDGNRFDIKDAAATAIGGLTGSAISYGLLKIFKKPCPAYAIIDKNSFQVGFKIIGFQLPHI